MDYVNFIYSESSLKVIREHINLLSKEQQKEIEGLFCFRKDYKLWDESKSKMDFFQTFHDMYIIGSLNNIQNIPEHKIKELYMRTTEKPSVYLTSCVHKGQRMFVNEYREDEVIKAWIKNAFEKNNEEIVTSLFNKFKSAVSLLRNPSSKSKFISSIYEVLNEFPNSEKFI